ncbi:MAG: T9SS type A sorting domain-containing protein [Bacteroidota bacterium]
MRPSLFFLLFFALNPTTNWACSCSGAATFCETIEGQDHLTIIKGKKIKQIEHGMEVEVLNVLRGNESKSTIKVWGDLGHLCRPYASTFPEEEVYIFALDKITELINPSFSSPLEEVDDYTISICGIYYSACDEPVNPFTGAADDLSDCFGFNPCDCGSSSLQVSPNPTRGPVQVQLPKSYSTLEQTIIRVYNIQGALVRWARIADLVGRDPESPISINLSGLAQGVYLIEYSTTNWCGNGQQMGKVLLH